MNKEEIIKQLAELQTRLDSEVDNYNIDNRVEEIEQITARIEKNNTVLKYYTEQLADDKNFVDETPLQYYLMLEAQELENLKSKQAAERENQDKILTEESIIASSEATILAGQEEIAKLGVDNTQFGIDIRRARLSSNKEKVDACESKIASNNKRVEEIEAQIGAIQTSIEQHTSVIESLNGLTENLKEQTAEAKTKYEEVVVQEKASKNGEIDLAKKNKAEAQLETLKTITSTLEQRSAAISYDFAGELRGIINGYTNSEINDEEMKAKLSELKAKLPEDFIKSDEAARNAEISENQRVQEILEVTVDDLTKKVANEDNYKVTPAQAAKIRAKLSACKKNMSSYDSQIAMLNSQIPSNELDLNEYQEMINLCNDENEEIARQIIFNNGVDKDLEAELTAKQKMNFTIIAEANELIENVNIDGLENTQVLAQLEERKARTEKLIASYQAELADENAIDRSKMRLDQIELANSKQGLNALKNREQFLNNSIIVTIDNIIGGNLAMNNGVEINENSTKPLPFASSDGVNLEDMSFDESRDIYSSSNPLPFAHSTEVNPEDMAFNDSQDISSIPVGEVNTKDSNEFADLNPDGFGANDDDLDLFGIKKTVSNDDEDEKIEEIDTSDVNENLRNKSKLDKFKTAFKKHWRKVAIIVTLIVVMVGLKSCDQDKVNKATDSIINNDKTMEDVIDSKDPDKSLQDFLDNNGLKIDDNKQDNTTPDKNTENSKPTQTPTNNNNNGKSETPHTEKAPAPTEKAADPVDPASIVDEHPDVKITLPHVDPVDPSTIIDEHPDVTPTPTPAPTPDQGTIIDNGGVTGNETVPDDAWDNETPVPNNTPTNGGVSGNETVPNNAWDNETPVIEGSSTNSNQTGNGSSTVVTPVPTPAPTPATPTPAPTSSTTTISVNPGDALIVNDKGVNYVSDNKSNYEAKPTDQDIFANDAVKSVSVATDETGKDKINVEINSKDAQRTTTLTDADVATISTENNINNDEIAQIEAQYKAQQAALEELKQQVKSSETTVTEPTAGITK